MGVPSNNNSACKLNLLVSFGIGVDLGKGVYHKGKRPGSIMSEIGERGVSVV